MTLSGWKWRLLMPSRLAAAGRDRDGDEWRREGVGKVVASGHGGV